MKAQISLPFEPELPTIIPPEQAPYLADLRADAFKKLKRSRLKHELTDRHLVVVSRYLDWLLSPPPNGGQQPAMGDTPCWPLDVMVLLRIPLHYGVAAGHDSLPKTNHLHLLTSTAPGRVGLPFVVPDWSPTLRQKAQEKPPSARLAVLPGAWQLQQFKLPLGVAA